MKPVLHDYQEQALDWLHANPKSALYLDMGLGKTLTTLSALTPDRLPALVTAPKRVAENVWHTEVDKWGFELTIRIAAGSPAKRQEALTSGADIVVIGRDNLADAVPHAKRFKTFVIDESSGFKNRSSVRWKTARKIVKTMSNVWELTGTPTPNGLMNLWSQVFLLDGGQRLGKTLSGFRGQYYRPGKQLPNGVITEWILREGANDAIMSKISDICLSMKAAGRIDLPPVTFNRVDVPLTPGVRKIYTEFEDTMVADLDLLGGEVHSAANAAVLSNKLSQVTAGFLYGEDGDPKVDWLHKEKLSALQEIVEGTGSPVLVFYRYQAERDAIMAALPDVHLIDEHEAQERWNAGKIPVLLAHPASAGHGLNLQYGGHTIVWSSLTWSLEEYEQGNGRIARQGQTQPVVIHHLQSPGTIDEVMEYRVLEKASVQDALMRYLESPL